MPALHPTSWLLAPVTLARGTESGERCMAPAGPSYDIFLFITREGGDEEALTTTAMCPS